MPPWPPVAEDNMEQLIQSYHHAVGHLRNAKVCTGLLFVGEGPPALIDRFLALGDRRYPCLALPNGQGQIAVFFTGDPTTAHDHIATEIVDAMRGVNLHLWVAIKSHYGFAASPEWQVNVREAGCVGGREFGVGWAKKEPDAAVWKKGHSVTGTRSLKSHTTTRPEGSCSGSVACGRNRDTTRPLSSSPARS